MPKRITLEHTVNTSPLKAQDYFSDFRKFSALHPLFVGLEETAPQLFVISERMPGIGITFKYKAQVTEKENKVTYVAYPFFLTLNLCFVFENGTTEHSCRIVETVDVKGPFPIAGILAGMVKKMHPKLIAKLNASLNG